MKYIAIAHHGHLYTHLINELGGLLLHKTGTDDCKDASLLFHDCYEVRKLELYNLGENLLQKFPGSAITVAIASAIVTKVSSRRLQLRPSQ